MNCSGGFREGPEPPPPFATNLEIMWVEFQIWHSKWLRSLVITWLSLVSPTPGNPVSDNALLRLIQRLNMNIDSMSETKLEFHRWFNGNYVECAAAAMSLYVDL